MVDAHDSKSCLARGVGSSPTSGTNEQMSQLCKQLAIIVYAGRGTRTESRRSPILYVTQSIESGEYWQT